MDNNDLNDLYTPQELIDEFPCLAKLGWTATHLGMLFSIRAFKGRKVGRKALITLESFKRFVDFYNNLNEEDPITLD